MYVFMHAQVRPQAESLMGYVALLWIHSFIHSFIFHFIHLQVQPMDVEIVIKCCAMYLLNYRCQMTEYNYNTVIT